MVLYFLLKNTMYITAHCICIWLRGLLRLSSLVLSHLYGNPGFSHDKVHVVSYFRLKFQLDIKHVLANSEAFDETARINRLV